jgi:hypothetical protein
VEWGNFSYDGKKVTPQKTPQTVLNVDDMRMLDMNGCVTTPMQEICGKQKWINY